jgi:hypothetical protein
MLTNQFPQSIDIGDPYYVTGAFMVASSVPRVVLYDTYHSMPSYAESLANGWMADDTHLNDLGEAELAQSC